jgi:hypothetical protein
MNTHSTVTKYSRAAYFRTWQVVGLDFRPRRHFLRKTLQTVHFVASPLLSVILSRTVVVEVVQGSRRHGGALTCSCFSFIWASSSTSAEHTAPRRRLLYSTSSMKLRVDDDLKQMLACAHGTANSGVQPTGWQRGHCWQGCAEPRGSPMPVRWPAPWHIAGVGMKEMAPRWIPIPGIFTI